MKKKILLIGDDIRMTSGVSTVLREIVIGTSHKYDWVCVGGAVNHPEEGKRLDLSGDTNKHANITDANVILYPTNGYGNPDLIRYLIKAEKPDAMMMMTDPRYYGWLFQIEHEIRKQIPIIYLNIWDNLPYPMYNKSFYESCDTLMAISKQTENINRVVLGKELAAEKIIKYCPHGVNENTFFPITSDNPEYLTLQEFKRQLYGEKEYEFALLYNARNIRRKSTSDLMLAWKLFIDTLPEPKAKKCALVMHTQVKDENGNDLKALSEMLFGNEEKYNIIFSENRYPPSFMNMLYNATDTTALVSSNEGWGLSLTEAMMAGKPIIATVTGGMQDQMRFEDEKGKWIEFTEEFGSNHFGKYRRHGIWAFPVYPSNHSLIGSIPTPYIFDDRVEPKDISEQIGHVYRYKTEHPSAYEMECKAARKWVTSDESMMSAKWMAKNVIEGVDETLDKWKPRPLFELIKVEPLKQPNHFVRHVIAE
ncbi:MAG: glycosyltransferase [Bacteroidetes bacterium]|nr:glycosyltransferase [Bacteroidota bacterium]